MAAQQAAPFQEAELVCEVLRSEFQSEQGLNQLFNCKTARPMQSSAYCQSICAMHMLHCTEQHLQKITPLCSIKLVREQQRQLVHRILPNIECLFKSIMAGSTDLFEQLSCRQDWLSPRWLSPSRLCLQGEPRVACQSECRRVLTSVSRFLCPQRRRSKQSDINVEGSCGSAWTTYSSRVVGGSTRAASHRRHNEQRKGPDEPSNDWAAWSLAATTSRSSV